MSGLIKRAAARDAAMPLPRLPAAPVAEREPVPDPRIAAFEAEIARLEAALDDERRTAAEAVVAARREGRDEAVADDAARTAAVADALADALAAWDARLGELDGVAAAIARIALAKVFGDDDDRANRVVQTIAHHRARLGEQAVIGIRVSAADVAGERFDAARDRIAIDPALAAGEARIDLRLGTVDVDPAAQWAVLDGALAVLERQA